VPGDTTELTVDHFDGAPLQPGQTLNLNVAYVPATGEIVWWCCPLSRRAQGCASRHVLVSRVRVAAMFV